MLLIFQVIAACETNGQIPVYAWTGGLNNDSDPENRADEPDPEGHGLLPGELGDAIRASMENGAAGICLFTPGLMTPEHWKELSIIAP